MKLELYTRLYLWLVAHRAPVLLATLVVTIVGVLIVQRVKLDEDILAALPERDPLVDEYKYTLRKFRQIDRVYIDVSVATDAPEKLAEAADAVNEALKANPAYKEVMYRLEGGGQQKVVDFLTGALPNLLTEADAQALAAKLEPASVREFLTVMRRKLAGPEGMVLKDVVAADPIGMSGLVVAKVLPLQTGFGDAQIVDGRITSGDGRHVLVVAEPKFGSSSSQESHALVQDLMRMVQDVEKRFPGVHVAITGGHRMSVDNATFIKADMWRCILLGMVAMLVLCYVAFRRKWLAAVAFLPSFFGTLMAGMILALTQSSLSAIAMGFATIAIGITVDYAIHVIYHLDDAAGSERRSVGRHLSRLVFPISMGALTTIAAFLVMGSSPMRGYRQLGIYGAIGVMISAAFALIILPLLVPVPKETGQPSLWMTRLLERFHLWRARKLPWLLLATVVLTVFSIIGVRKLRYEGDPAKLNGITTSTREDEELIRKTWGDALGMTVVVARGATEEEMLLQNDRAAEVLAGVPGISAVYSLAAVCPATAKQKASIQRWHEFWTPARRDTLRQTLQQIGTELGFRPDAFAPFWRRIESEPALLTLDLFRGTPLEQVLNERVVLAPGDNAVSTLLKVDDRSQVERLRRALPGMIVIDQKSFVDHLAAMSKSGLARFALWTSLLVGGILVFSLASAGLVFATVLPICFGLLWTFGAMGLLGLPIDMINSIFVIFVIGVSEDYSLFLATSKLDEWRGRPQRMAATSASVLISALTTIGGFGVLVFAQHPILFSMGTTVLLGMSFAFIATLVLTPLCMDLLLFHEQPRGAPRWWHLLGTVWAGVHLAGIEIFLYYILRPWLKIFSPRSADDKVRTATRYLGRGVVKGLPFGKLEFQNITPATFNPPCIVISNHQSAVYVMLVVSLPSDVRQTAKKRVFDNPMLGIGCKLCGHVLVEPNDPETTLRRCREKLAEGASVHFYPEGTRSPDGWVQRFHRGAFELAVELNQEILPVVLCDTWTAMPRDAYWFEPYHVTVRALPRITPQTFDYSLGSTALMRHCETIVRDALQRQLDEINTPKILRRKVKRLYRYQGTFVEQFVHWKLKMDPMFLSLDRIVPRDGFVLDLGCGYGLATHWLAYTTDRRNFLGVDYDEDKIRVAQRTAPQSERIKFELRDLLEWEYPECDTILLLDVLHYWTPEKQQSILDKARRALRPGGRLVLRDAARAVNTEHQRVEWWEKLATGFGHNKTEEGLHFQTLPEMESMLQRAGFAQWEIIRDGGRDSNVLLVARAARLV
ncbi:MAG TPA: MMPL family transporter [Methylomirabilota bacterium]|nr:MMPL family transporter [Methylomirabilota bacterium]